MNERVFEAKLNAEAKVLILMIFGKGEKIISCCLSGQINKNRRINSLDEVRSELSFIGTIAKSDESVQVFDRAGLEFK
ncbi:hypothetical protein ACET3Z_003986 [Daucus carota]